MKEKKRNIAILGSTGSIGTQALEVVDQNPEFFGVSLLTANRNAEKLIEQAIKYQPNAVVICDKEQYARVKDILYPKGIKVFAGAESIEQIIGMEEIDIVLTAMVGFAGLRSTIKAILEGKTIALANKETLVVAGEYITRLARERGVNIFPVDSEHSAIFQCLVGEFDNPVEKIYLTASGGPFRGRTPQQLRGVTRKEALKHPNWEMGAKITIDSATLMNKGLEVIEARWLFNLPAERIEVLVHPQSIIHSMVQFEDGSIKAQLGLPDMRLPIQYALAYPARIPNSFKRMDFETMNNLTFEKPDTETFRNLGLAFETLKMGGNAACILNAANEVAVDAFLKEKIDFLKIFEINEQSLSSVGFISNPSVDDYFDTDQTTREFAKKLIA